MRISLWHKKKIALCISVPHKEDQFKEWCGRKTDFWRHICEAYKSDQTDFLWAQYSKTAEAINTCIEQLRSNGVNVFDEFRSTHFPKVITSDIIIFIAHKQSQPEAIELWDSALSPIEFAEKIPKSYRGTIDICCCNSKDILEQLRIRCLDKENIIAPDAPVILAMHTCLLPAIIDTVRANRKITYLEAFRFQYANAYRIRREQELQEREERQRLEARLKELNNKDNETHVSLGEKKNDISTLYAPRAAVTGETFEVQLYFHHPEDRNEVEIRAKNKDNTVVFIEEKSLKLLLNDGDDIEARLLLDNNEGNDFIIKNNPVYHTEWDDTIENATFRIFVREECKKNRCDCTMQLFVNEQPKGDMTFHVDIVKDANEKDKTSTTIDKVITQEEKRIAAAEELRSLLFQRLDQESTSEEEKEVIARCLRLLDSNDAISVGHKNVFVSSTGDLKKYREAVTAGIISLEKNLNPILYENWTAESIRPCDKCSEKVMESDYFILILGSRYGHIEEKLELSMTQIEYLVAVFSGKKILAFIEKNVKADDKKQQEFMAKVRNERLVSEFGSEETLKYQVENALRKLVTN